MATGLAREFGAVIFAGNLILIVFQITVPFILKSISPLGVNINSSTYGWPIWNSSIFTLLSRQFVRHRRQIGAGYLFSSVFLGLFLYFSPPSFGQQLGGGLVLEYSFPMLSEAEKESAQISIERITRFAEPRWISSEQSGMTNLSILLPANEKTTKYVSAIENSLSSQFSAVLINRFKLSPSTSASAERKNALIVFGTLLLVVLILLVPVGPFRHSSNPFEKVFLVAIALLSDLILTSGVLAFLDIPFDLSVFVALAVLVAYSVDDSIVVLYELNKSSFYSDEEAIISALPRSLSTSFTTIVAILPIAVLAATTFIGYSLCLVIGLIFGTISSLVVVGGFTKNRTFVKEKVPV